MGCGLLADSPPPLPPPPSPSPAAVTALLYTALHVCLTIVAFDAYRSWTSSSAPSKRLRLAYAPALHLAFALAVLLPGVDSPGACVATLPVLAAVVVASAVLVGSIVAAPDYLARRQLRAYDLLTQRQRVEAMRRAAESRGAVEGVTGAPRGQASGGAASVPAQLQQRRGGGGGGRE